MEKKYKINDEFIDILIKHGFVDATLKQHLNKPQKRRFKKPNINGQRTITFDYDSIVISPGEDSRNEISEGELKLVLLFFQIKKSQFKDIIPNGEFDFEEGMIGVSSLKKEISRLKDYGKAPKKLIRLENLLTQYNSILI